MQKATLEGAPFRGANNATGVIRRDPATTADNRKRLFALHHVELAERRSVGRITPQALFAAMRLKRRITA
ncbi:hypothetical protein DK265_08715 [Pseudomonas aeruginosa]|nr:hypothetical protein DK265_08715 [Pseudomonas aeruginosa]